MTVLQLVSDTRLSPANPSALQLSFTNPTRSAQVHRLQQQLGAHSPGEMTPGGRQLSKHTAPKLSDVHQCKDRPTPSPRDSSFYTSRFGLGAHLPRARPAAISAQILPPGKQGHLARQAGLHPCPALLPVTACHSLPRHGRTSPTCTHLEEVLRAKAWALPAGCYFIPLTGP